MRKVSSVIVLVGIMGVFGSQPALAQTRPALVRSVDEPARVPYVESLAPTCGFTNQCISTFATVPAGKRLRVTSISGAFFFTNVSGFIGFHHPAVGSIMFPVAPFNAAYFGTVVSFNQQVDRFYEAGQTPSLEFGVQSPNTIFVDSRNRLTITGYLVDIAP